jgi:hypothetical protein
MMVIKKEDFDKTTDVNGSGISLDHLDSGDMSLTQITGKMGISNRNSICYQ